MSDELFFLLNYQLTSYHSFFINYLLIHFSQIITNVYIEKAVFRRVKLYVVATQQKNTRLPH